MDIAGRGVEYSKGKRGVRSALWLSAAALAVILAFAACGKGKLPAGSGILPGPSSALTQLEKLPCPEGVEVTLWDELKDALNEALVKAASIPPAGNDNKVADLAISDNGDGTFTLTWHYQNLGDYDQNGAVGIEDITPLAIHFGEEVPEGDSERNSIQAVVDGSGNNVVDIADITPIAQNFQREVHHYAVEGVDDYEQPYIEVAQVQLPGHDNTARLELTHDLGVPPYRYWRVVPVDAEDNRGQASNVVSTQPGEPPQIISVSPTEGDSGTEATFSAEVTGDGPFTYYWDFAGGASPNESSVPAPTVTLSRGGTLPEPVHAYSAALTVNTPYGSATHPFNLDISAWWHVEEIPKVPGYGDITSATYAFGPDGSLWGKQSYSTPPGNFLVRISDGQMVEYEEVEGTLAVDKLNNPARIFRVETGFLTYDYYFSRRLNGQWSEGELLEGGVTDYYMPTQLFFDSANQPVIVYTMYSNEIWVARRTAPGEWAKTRVWEAGTAFSWKCALDADDIVHILCTGEGESSVIHYWVNGETVDQEVVLDTHSVNVFYGVRAVVARNGTGIRALVGESDLELGRDRVILVSRADSDWEPDEIMQLDEGLYPGVWGLVLLESGSAVVYLGGFYPQGNPPLLAFGIDSIWQAVPLSEELDLSELEINPMDQLTLISRNAIAAFW